MYQRFFCTTKFRCDGILFIKFQPLGQLTNRKINCKKQQNYESENLYQIKPGDILKDILRKRMGKGFINDQQDNCLIKI